MTQKEVRANQKGFYKDRLIQENEVFLVHKSETALWFDDVAVTPVNTSTPTGGTQGSGESDPEDKPPAYSRMNKAELTLEAAKAGIELTGNETNAQIVELLTTKDSQE